MAMNQMSMSNVKQVARARKNYHQLCCSAELFYFLLFVLWHCMVSRPCVQQQRSSSYATYSMPPSQRQIAAKVTCGLSIKKEQQRAAIEPDFFFLSRPNKKTKRRVDSGITVRSLCS